MSYVDAIFDRDNDTIRVVERLPNGKRVFKDNPVKYNFFYEDPRGKYTSIFGTSLTKVTCHSTKDFRKEVNMLQGKKLFESDLNPVFAHLSEHYQDVDPPKLNVCFFDIETDFCKERGYAPPEDPFLPITSIGAYMQWCDKMYVLAVPPKTLTMETAKLMFADMPEVELYETESEMLTRFLDIIEDADILTGWNSESFDIPFIVNRMIKTIGKDETRRLCHWNQRPKKREFEKYGNTAQTYDLVGRVHLDYLDLYRKYRMEERHSYKLDYIGEIEVGEKKVAYNGTLDQLYNKDFRKFVEYNKQDVLLLDKIDKALKYIDLANSYAHQNTVLLPTVLGAVAAIEQALINEAHKLGLRVPNRVMKKSSQAAGAYVAYPKIGLHKWVGSTDINSLYPSTIRALNMSPETIIGQIRQDYTDEYINEQITLKKKSFAAAWEGKFACLEYEFMMEKDSTRKLIIDWEDGNTTEHTADEVYQIIFESGLPWTISANGTIFTYEKEGLIPGTLAKWYANRKKMQAVSKKFAKMENGVPLPQSIAAYSFNNKIDESVIELRYMDWGELEKLIESEDTAGLEAFMSKYGLEVRDGKIFAKDPNQQALAYDYWDRRQHTLKIALNSAYGSLLNEGCRFFDKRIGQSTTLSGRQIVKHMNAQINQIICAEYNHVGDSILYADTDSCYFSAYRAFKEDIDAGNIPWTKDSVIQLYDHLGEEVNKTFPDFMQRSFNCPHSRGQVIKSGREIVAPSALFITKKRYAAMVCDVEGKRTDLNGSPGYLKAMGLDLKRSDTPEYIQDFLKEILTMVLTDASKEDIMTRITEYRSEFRAMKPWEKGSPKRANNITAYQEKEETSGKANMPGHVRASINWNTLRRMNNDRYSAQIVDGTKVVVCKLKPNDMGFTSIARPVDEERLPKWFTDLPFDEEAMEETLLDGRLENLIGVLEYDLSETRADNTFNNLFDW